MAFQDEDEEQQVMQWQPHTPAVDRLGITFLSDQSTARNDHSAIRCCYMEFISMATITMHDDNEHSTLGEHGLCISPRCAMLQKNKR